MGMCLGSKFCIFGMYVLTRMFLTSSDAVFFNLSLLTSDLYGALFSWLGQHARFTWMYAVAFVITMVGLVVYHLFEPISGSDVSGSDRGPGISNDPASGAFAQAGKTWSSLAASLLTW